MNIEKIQLTKTKFLIESDYKNQFNQTKTCGLIVTIDNKNGVFDVQPSNTQEKDITNDKRPLWRAINKLIEYALKLQQDV